MVRESYRFITASPAAKEMSDSIWQREKSNPATCIHKS